MQKWRTLDSGFMGFTTYAPMKLRAECEEDYSLEGLKANISGEKKTCKGIIVCIESQPPSRRGTPPAPILDGSSDMSSDTTDYDNQDY